MASSSRQTLPPSGVSQDFLGLSSEYKEIYKKIDTDPEFIQFVEENQRLKQGGNEVDQAQVTNIMVKGMRVMKRLLPSRSLESYVNHEVIENYAEHMEYMRKDPELTPIFAELDANCPLALMNFSGDEDVLKKLGKGLRKFHETSTHGDVKTSLECGGNKDDDVSEGRKALQIVSEFAKMKYMKVLLKAKAKRKAAREAA